MRPKTLAIIPARSGSKSIRDKNIIDFLGKPLIAHSIEHALQSMEIDRVIVSTDSPGYAEIARKYGAETPFIRPDEISGDESTDLECFHHALNWLQQNEGGIPEILVHLRPTYPIRRISDIDNIVRVLRQNPELDSVRSISIAPEPPFKMWFKGEHGLIDPVVKSNIPDAHSIARQQLPKTYLQNAAIDAVRSRTILEMNSMAGNKIFGYEMSDNFDIDYGKDLDRARRYARVKELMSGNNNPGTFVFDIDGIIATIIPDNDYNKSEPIRETIGLINRLYKAGNKIILFTARGYVTGMDWKAITEDQMNKWGVQYHELKFGKPATDYYIDDKSIELNELLKIINS